MQLGVKLAVSQSSLPGWMIFIVIATFVFACTPLTAHTTPLRGMEGGGWDGLLRRHTRNDLNANARPPCDNALSQKTYFLARKARLLGGMNN
jgi:hypothetical protein